MASQQTSPPNTTPEDVVLDYFVQNKNNSNWREADFRKQHPDHNFQSELDKLAKRELDGDASLKKIIRHARRLESKPDANVVNNIYNSGTVGAIGNPNSVEIININENIPRKRQRPDAPDTDEEHFADSEDDRVPVTHQGTPSTINQDIYSSGPASDTLLQTDLSNYIFLDGPHASNLPDTTTLELLDKKFPKLPAASPYFHAALEACKPMIDDPRYWPNPPHGDWSKKDELEQSKIWHYVITAVSYFVNNYATIRLRAPTHGEGWADVNIWALLWDHAFLKSDTLTIDRKELSPNVRIATKHDGILRSAKTSCNRSLGYIEVKPERNTNQNAKGVLADRLKVIETIVATLKAHNTPGIIIGGIICNGMTVNILRGADLGNGQYAFKESSLDVSLETILYVVLSCWRMKLALEASYSTIVATLPQNVFE